jgi:hypothetical protein
MPEYLPFPPPSEHKPRPARVLNDERQEKYTKALIHFSDEKYEVPGGKKGPLSEEERFWLVRNTLLKALKGFYKLAKDE